MAAAPMNIPITTRREYEADADKGTDLPNDPDNYHLEFAHPGLVLHGGSKLVCGAAQRCGGCPEFERTPSEQRSLKGQALRAGLSARNIAYDKEIAWLAGKETAYRNRIRLAIRDGEPCYFNRDKDPRCAVLEPTVLEALIAFQSWAAPRQTALANYCVAEVRARDADGQAAVYLRHTQRNGLSQPAPDWTSLPDRFDNVMVAVEGGPLRVQRFFITEGIHARVPVGGFMQVNFEANRLMVHKVVEWARVMNARRVLDLYSGSGNFTLPVAAAGSAVVAVESDVAACLALRDAATEQSLGDVAVTSADAQRTATAMACNGETYDLVIADPPRGGLRGNVGPVCDMASTAVLLVSCDATRFCDDARALCDHGLRFSECVADDMFPHTRHVEVLGLFTCD